MRSDPKEKNTGAQPSGKYGGAAACKAVPRHQLRHNKVLSFRQLLYFLRPGTMSRVTTASLSIALQAIPLTRQVTTASLSMMSGVVKVLLQHTDDTFLHVRNTREIISFLSGNRFRCTVLCLSTSKKLPVEMPTSQSEKPK